MLPDQVGPEARFRTPYLTKAGTLALVVSSSIHATPPPTMQTYQGRVRHGLGYGCIKSPNPRPWYHRATPTSPSMTFLDGSWMNLGFRFSAFGSCQEEELNCRLRPSQTACEDHVGSLAGQISVILLHPMYALGVYGGCLGPCDVKPGWMLEPSGAVVVTPYSPVLAFLRVHSFSVVVGDSLSLSNANIDSLAQGCKVERSCWTSR